MKKKIIQVKGLVILFVLFSTGCNIPKITARSESKNVPNKFSRSMDTTAAPEIRWKDYFTDQNLVALIDTALKNNQELNMIAQEIEMRKNEIMARKGEYLPFLNVQGAAGLEKAGRYTRNGAVEENLTIKEDQRFPEPLPDFMIGVYASWELDVWKKLRNAKKAAVSRYMASAEGKNFVTTYIVAEIASSYYELMALDNHLDIINKNIEIQKSAFETIKLEKENARVTQLAVNRFQAQLLHTQNLQYEVKQRIVETENRINFLTGKFQQPISRNSVGFYSVNLDSLKTGIPSQLLANRPDIRQAELELEATKLDVKSAKANFYPSFRLTAGAGFNAFNPTLLVSPKSILYGIAGDLVAPLINRNAIKAMYQNANAAQIQAAFHYEQTILNAYVDVQNHIAKIDNYSKSFETKSKEVEILTQSISISNSLYKSARADYTEVLLTQREALESKLELVEIKLELLHSKVNIYRALGGGWK